MERGDVWWARFSAPIGTRPVVLLSRNEAYRVRRSVTVALVTTRVRGIPVEVPLAAEDGMPRPSVVNCDEVHTVPLSAIANRITGLTPDTMNAVANAVRFALDMECE